jgi:hypothetical protein
MFDNQISGINQPKRLPATGKLPVTNKPKVFDSYEKTNRNSNNPDPFKHRVLQWNPGHQIWQKGNGVRHQRGAAGTKTLRLQDTVYN